MITALIVVASLLGAMLVFAHFGRYWVRTRVIPRLVREGFCETCMGISLRGENPYERPLTFRAEAFFGFVYLIFSMLGDAVIDRIIEEFLRRVRSEPDMAQVRTWMHPDCRRGRCACGIPRCDGHGPDEKIVMETHASPSEARPFGVPCSCPGCAKAVLTEEELEALESARISDPPPPPEA